MIIRKALHNVIAMRKSLGRRLVLRDVVNDVVSGRGYTVASLPITRMTVSLLSLQLPVVAGSKSSDRCHENAQI